jgi:hypothetical protein
MVILSGDLPMVKTKERALALVRIPMQEGRAQDLVIFSEQINTFL